jgi:two-component system chemotaxis sensor kinase CheA
MDTLLEQFLQEARENLAFIDQHIDEIKGEDPELINSVFRAAHTLKGGSGIVGFDSIRDITHHAEDLLDMLRSKKIEFKQSMTEALYNAFDEVMNLVEAAEESGDIVNANAEVIEEIIAVLNEQMNREVPTHVEWSVPFSLVRDSLSIINKPMTIFNGKDDFKIPFVCPALSEEFCQDENLYAVLFDVDESCMVYGNDPAYALSLLGDKVVGVYSCMSQNSAKSVLSGIDDEDGLLLKTSLIAYVYSNYADIEDSLYNFIDELLFMPVDIAALLSISEGDAGHKLDSLKELSNLAQSDDKELIINKIAKAMELIGNDTLQYAQLQRVLDIIGLVRDDELTKLSAFFANLYKGEVYSHNEVETTVSIDEQALHASEELVEPEAKMIPNEPVATIAIEVTQDIVDTSMEILDQQYKALAFVNTDDDLQRVLTILAKARKFVSDIPENLYSKEDIKKYLESKLQIKPTQQVEEKQILKAPTLEIKEQPIKSIELAEKTEVVVDDAVDSKIKTGDESKKSVVGKTVKIEQESIDSLMNVVGELLVAKNSLPYLADNVVSMSNEMIKREIMEKYIFINRLSEQLQDLIMSMRMLPISYVFDRYPKLVRDIAKKLGKKVNLEMDGGETKLDKNIIEMLADPMIHIMRNSLDHGIEAPEVREGKGKNPHGTVKLKAYAESDRIIIEIKDDGAGINVEKVANKVLEKGLMSIEQLDSLSADELAELVMLPGLSTADSITEYSGRGVGMDVVKKSIESFGGSIKIRTRINKGTTIILAIPVSLAVTSLLHILMNDIHYGIPMDSVSETVKLERDEIEYLHNEPFIYLRGEVIPLLFIKSMLNEDEMKNEPLSIVVLNIKDNLLAVVVNKFLGQLDVVQKPLVGIMESHPLFSGTALLGNGQIIMAIDPIGLLSISQSLKNDIQVA